MNSVMKPIYLDHNATTPLDPRVLEAMSPYLVEHFGNASSNSHPYGWRAQMAVEKARTQVADLLGCALSEVIFTSGATESNNLALQGSFIHLLESGSFSASTPPHFITSNYEHKAVLEVFDRLKVLGAEVTFIDVDEEGRVLPGALKKALKPNTYMVSIMGANNEIGSINPVRDLAQVCSENGVLFHTDCAQLVGRQDLNFARDGISLMSLSGHKIYGPKGIGALIIKEDVQKKIAPFMVGGAQEKGIRPGTLNVAGIVGLGEACALLSQSMDDEIEHLSGLQRRILDWAKSYGDEVVINGCETERLCNNVSLSFKTLPADRLRSALKTVAFSSGSACTSANPTPSHVLMALGRDQGLAQRTVRLGLGRKTTADEIQFVLEQLTKTIES
ncbi:MAG: IscS subfamily cysteine desulfurase [Bdellovibrionaceae bacterium]|nr:IscS subfamily cysteine desulfurase [Pseudobdellovibrionaceae bacterium]|tara:strand:+ start:441 stop:1607 length:1167 start_codon:yes stop_codon:yes gene_type:complete